MTAVTFIAQKGSYRVAGYVFSPGQTLDVKADVAEQIKNDPDADGRFLFNNRLPAKTFTAAERPKSQAPQDQVQNFLPSSGFKTKAEAKTWCETHLPGYEFSEAKALKILNTEIADAYRAVLYPREAREEAVISEALALKQGGGKGDDRRVGAAQKLSHGARLRGAAPECREAGEWVWTRPHRNRMTGWPHGWPMTWRR